MIRASEFAKIQGLVRKHFDLDAFACDNGVNKVCEAYCSPRNSFFDADISGKHVWINPPFDMLPAAVERYLQQKSKSPAQTSACILVPDWPVPWKGKLEGMQVLTRYPAGYPLFEMPLLEGVGIQNCKGTPWPMVVYYDAPYKSIGLKAAASEGCTMRFRGTANGAPALIAADTMASCSFIDKSYASDNGFRYTPTHRIIELADGSQTVARNACVVNLRIPGVKGQLYKCRRECLVVDLGADFDVILGDD